MKRVLILGANGQVAREAIDLFLKETDAQLTLYLRNSSRLQITDANRERVIEGDVNDLAKLKEAMVGQDVVYVNLGGSDIVRKTQNIILAMDELQVKRAIFINILGIYGEVPGEFGKWNRQMVGSGIETWRKAADLIEESNLDYSILRCTWFTNKNEIDYELTEKGEPLTGTEISRKSIASLVVRLAESEDFGIRKSLGVSKPYSSGDKPTFY
ncbi:SDR family oxidoreductase [Paenibacillus sp. JX-17]|uniref:SDR family oxidoreductase n=1 Tax=Paenibacillus lacisoli TaxID=3064525 RepID=A0ABT9C887_9BACL|nr:SDR family oxidoreductase [Paenibacillus sp. JX-17]MDO7904823.1 SDR family oxidoreductase [Paenibacillus sp. JX-17]